MKTLLLITALAVLSACSARLHDGNVIYYDEGGRVDTYEAWSAQPKRIAGTCISACTLYLRTGCVEPGAVLVFHPPGFNSLQPPAVHRYWAERIAGSYPDKLAAWYLNDWQRARTLTGAEAIGLGARRC